MDISLSVGKGPTLERRGPQSSEPGGLGRGHRARWEEEAGRASPGALPRSTCASCSPPRPRHPWAHACLQKLAPKELHQGAGAGAIWGGILEHVFLSCVSAWSQFEPIHATAGQ